jgi:metal-responsive CopG/Arc/MetJ family transcriptional regulator
MGRVTVHVADSMLSALDTEAHNRSISRSQAVALAVDAFISGVNQANLEAHNLETELSGTKEEVMRLRQ